MSTDTIREIIQAVAADGFRPRLIADGLELHGEIKAGAVSVPMQIRFEDLTLAASPRCFLPDTSMLRRKVVPHLDEDGEYCVVNRQQNVFDRYRAPGQTRGLIVRAKEVLERGMTKAGTAEIADEFSAYWSSSYLNLPGQGDGEGKSLNLATVTTAASLSFEAHQAKPETVAELLEWASYWDETLEKKILAAVSRLTPHDPMVEIHAANATVIARLMVSALGTKTAQALVRPKAWERYVNGVMGRRLKIERIEGRRIDLVKIFGMNGLAGQPPLAGRKIVLIGCGAIGGYLARMLVQTGAGLGVPLTLIDPDKLDRKNIRRHQLGLDYLGRFKAEGCAETIARDFPGVEISHFTDPAQRHLGTLGAADLVIDATGEQEFSDWLNDWALQRRAASERCPALQFVYITGTGAATQSFIVIDEQYACYRCLQTELGKLGRLDPRRELTPEPVAACGQQPFTAYGPAASTAAASLASSHAVDWAEGNPHHLLRTIRIDWDTTVRRDPKSPDRASDCPACGGK